MRTRIRFVLGLASSMVVSGAAVGQTCAPTWTTVNTVGPSERSFAAMAYDADHARTVLFGGWNDNTGTQSDTWTWSGTAWTARSSSGPARRSAAAMAYDSARGRAVLFGGTDSGNPGGGNPMTPETWEWDGTAWALVATAGPTGRAGHCMAYDSGRHVTVLFGGGPFGQMSNETWEWNGTAWTQRSFQTQPPVRREAAMCFDSGRGVTVMFGGLDPNAAPLSDTWEWDGNDWRLAATFGPSPRFGAVMAFDSNRGLSILFGGVPSYIQPNSGALNETWEWDGSGWTQRDFLFPAQYPPDGLYAASMAYDSTLARVVVFGGLQYHDQAAPRRNTIDLRAGAGPTVPTQSGTQSIEPGERATMFVEAADTGGTGTLTYQWRKNGFNIACGGRVSGCNSPVLVIDPADESDSGTYDCVISNACNSTQGAPASLTVQRHCGSADFNGDGDIGTDADIEAFFRVLAGGHC